MLKAALHKKIHYVLLLALGFLIPFCMYQTVRFTGLTIILLGANMLLSGFWLKVKWKDVDMLSKSIIALFLISVIGFFYSENLKSAGQLLESRVILIAIPLIFIVMGSPSKRVINNLFWWVYGGIVLSSLLIFKDGIAPFINTYTEKGCLSCVMELLIPMHRPYYGMLMIIIVAFSLSEIKNMSLLFRFLILLINVYLVIILLLMMPKMVLISVVVGIFGILVRFNFMSATPLKNVLVLISFIGIVTSFGFLISLVNTPEQQSANTLESSVVSRKVLWEASFNTLKNPKVLFLGVGLGDEADMLFEYSKVHYPTLMDKPLNAHNQYLSEWLKFGLLGLIVIALMGVYPIYKMWEYKSLLGIFITVVWALNLLTENYLNREAGLLILTVMVLPFVNSIQEKDLKSAKSLI